jgi:uncharacterized membrane protein
MKNSKKVLSVANLLNKLYEPNFESTGTYLGIIGGLSALFAVLATVLEKKSPEFFDGCKYFGLAIIFALLYAPMSASRLEKKKETLV